MVLQSRLHKKNTLLPTGMVIFFKRRIGQFSGFLLLTLAVALAISLGTYYPLDPSWNLAIEGSVQNRLGFPGAIMADALLQTFGVACVWVLFSLGGWGIRLMVASSNRWGFFRIFSLAVAILLAATVAAQWPLPQTWNLPNGVGGALGDILLNQFHQWVGSSLLAFTGITFLASVLSFILFLVGLGASFHQIIKGFFTLNVVATMSLYRVFQGFAWMGQGIQKVFAIGRREPSPFMEEGEEFDELPVNDHLDTQSVPSLTLSPEPVQNFLHVTPEDRAIYVPDREQAQASSNLKSHSAPIMWPEDTSSKLTADMDERDGDLLAPQLSTQKINYSYESTFSSEEYALPSIDLLDSSVRKTTQTVDPQALEDSAHTLKTVLEEFGVRGEIVAVRPGPVVTLYEFKPAPGIKTSRVIGLADDIARSMSALSARIAVIPGRNVIGIELPNPTRETVYLRELLQAESYEKTTSHLALILGKDIGGYPVIADLTRMPHLLVAGTTGSGKSVAVNTMILSLLFRLSPHQCKFIMIDPKMLELSVYDGIPHLLSPVVTDPKKAVVALKWAVREMESRYRAMSKLGVRNIDGYNARIQEARQTGELLVRRVQTGFDPDSGKPIFENQSLDFEPLPYIVVVVDEMADLMLVAGKEIEAAVQRLAQMARAAGIHLIMATQRPSVDVITGTIKANFPTRISFQVTSKIDSRTILGEQGAEQLLGQGDMLYMAGGGRITRVHGPFVRDEEVERIVAFLKMQGEPSYIDGVTDEEEDSVGFDEGGNKGDALYQQAVELVIREGKASTSFIQRHLQIGYNKAAGIIEMMEKNGIVSEANHVGKREVLR